jgi:hypothetical protein
MSGSFFTYGICQLLSLCPNTWWQKLMWLRCGKL